MPAPNVDGHKPKRIRCADCGDCRQAVRSCPRCGQSSRHAQAVVVCPTDCGWPEPVPWWVTCGGVYSLIWAVCADAARLELERIMRLKSVGRGWGTSIREPSHWDDERRAPRHPRDVLAERLDNAGITARLATDEDRERWRVLVRQNELGAGVG